MRELTVPATIDNVEKVTEFVNGQLEEAGCPMKTQMQLDVAIDELFSNIAHYAYDPGTGMATVQVDMEKDPRAAVVTFLDQGRPYDPLAKKDPDVSLAAHDRPTGGLGIFLVKRIMDDVSYEYREGHNILRIRKKY